MTFAYHTKTLKRQTLWCFSVYRAVALGVAPLISRLSVSSHTGAMFVSPSRRSVSRTRRETPPASSALVSIPSLSTPEKKRQLPRTEMEPSAITPETSPTRFLTSELVRQTNRKEAYVEIRGASAAELRPSSTLTTGQCFHWRAVETAASLKESAWGSHNATEWVGVVRASSGQSVVLSILETPFSSHYRVLHGPASFDYDDFLRSYFQLEISLTALYDEWSVQCPRLKKIAKCIPGVRIIDQDPWECLVSFICSSNNNIPRITKILNALRKEYGERLMAIGDDVLYSFPSHEKLMVKATEDDLRKKCGMGYRARYLMETMQVLDSLGGEKYLQELRNMNDPVEVQDRLLQFCGVGRKVADCVSLFSLKQCNAIPVDVHVWSIARRDYDEEGLLQNAKSLSPKMYHQVGKVFRSRFPRKSGWAHSLLFVAELPSFRSALPERMIQSMDEFRAQEKERKKAKRELNDR
jgi:N-glycosylase/DNA lyase